MKRFLSLILAAALLVLSAGCTAEGTGTSSHKEKENTETAVTDSTSPETVGTEPSETTGISAPEKDPEYTTGVSDTTAAPAPGEDTAPEETETETAEETTLPEGTYEIIVTDDAGDEWVVGSSNIFGSYDEAASETETDLPEAELTETAPFEPETTVPEPPVTEPEPEPEPEEPSEPSMYPTVLMYHCIHDEPYTVNTGLFVRPSDLEEQIQLLQELDIDCLFASEFGAVSKNSVILTFDDGYEDNYTYMFPIIKKYNIKVTVFMIAYKIDSPGYLTTEQIKEMSDSGLVEFGSHTLDHPSLTTLSEDAIREQFAGASWIISQKTGKAVTSIAYPSGDYNETVMRIAREYYSFAYTTDDDVYWGQDYMMLPRYAIYRDHTIHTFRMFVE